MSLKLLPLIALSALGLSAATPDWTGYHAGFSLSTGLNTTLWKSDSGNVDYGTRNTNGLVTLAGVSIGQDWTYGKGIFGMEFTYEAGLGQNSQETGSTGYSVTRKDCVAGLATLTGRYGILRGQSLLYVKGGLGYGDIRHRFNPAESPEDAFTVHDRQAGLVLGGGIERKLNEAWSWKAEFNHFEGFNCSVTGLDDEGFKVRARMDTLKLGLNWHF
nr:outer membrane beta-barrel protein [uncultured Holophaga sp.]